jgi:cysteine-rich CWC protein
MRGPISKVCECCKQGFTCGQYGCWCSEVSVSERQMTWIEKSFHDCLCPLCLQRIVDGELGPAFVSEPE